ncbi:hypothetical protein BVX99_02575 [bacterium F16]|nr:hypothetical protein BVX99_02575 [bacterium F16]
MRKTNLIAFAIITIFLPLSSCKKKGPTIPDTKDLIETAEKNNDPVAYRRLGERYAAGTYGCEKDWNKAIEYSTKGADQGDITAMSNLATWYSTGKEGVPQDDQKSKMWYKKIVESDLKTENEKILVDVAKNRLED